MIGCEHEKSSPQADLWRRDSIGRESPPDYSRGLMAGVSNRSAETLENFPRRTLARYVSVLRGDLLDWHGGPLVEVVGTGTERKLRLVSLDESRRGVFVPGSRCCISR